MKTILVTGATGFLGSALVVTLLAEGLRVRALSRSDPTGARTRTAVEQAALGFGLPLNPEAWARLSVVEVDFQALAATLGPQHLEDVTDVWNVAAEMSYSTRRIFQSLEQNVFASCQLYTLVARHARQCQRFYHVSTAYVAGSATPEAREQLHLAPRLINGYQLSKWMAELNLVHHQRELGLPLTLFRPSIIIGHQETGWSTGAPFGMFSLAEVILGGKRMGAEHLQLEVRADCLQDLVCVDTVVDRALALLKAGAWREPVEIFHCVADERFPMEQALEPAWRMLGMGMAFGPPRTDVEVELNRLFEGNKPFTDRTWVFHTEGLKRVLGAAYRPGTMTVDTIGRSIRHFLSHRLRQLSVDPLSRATRGSALSARPGAGIQGTL
jgi:nucleoside-diphosphate-sugar epimerase